MNSKLAPDDDDEIVQGVTMNQLCEIFEMDHRDVKERLQGTPVGPCGVRRGRAIYLIKDVAPHLVRPAFKPDSFDMAEFIRQLKFIPDIPPIVRKELWAAMRSQQAYLKESGELVELSKFEEVIAILMKTLRTQLLLIRDAVERESELSERQRAIVQHHIDNALESCYAATVSQFSTPTNGGGKSAVPISARFQPGEDDL